MIVLVRSSYDDDRLENLIQNAINDFEEVGFLTDVKYSTCFDVTSGQILRSAVLLFEEYAEDDEDAEYDEDDD